MHALQPRVLLLRCSQVLLQEDVLLEQLLRLRLRLLEHRLRLLPAELK
jgi:hypothetical protein